MPYRFIPNIGARNLYDGPPGGIVDNGPGFNVKTGFPEWADRLGLPAPIKNFAGAAQNFGLNALRIVNLPYTTGEDIGANQLKRPYVYNGSQVIQPLHDVGAAGSATVPVATPPATGFTFNPNAALVNPYALGSSAANVRPGGVGVAAPPTGAGTGAIVATDRAGNGYTLQDLANAAAPLSKYGVTAEQLTQYARSEMNRNDSHMDNFTPYSLAAAADNLWAQEATRVGVLRPDNADLIWKEPWAFNNGFGSGRDPLLTGHPESVKRLQGQAEQMVREQRQSGWGAFVQNAQPAGGGDELQALRDRVAQLEAQQGGGGQPSGGSGGSVSGGAGAGYTYNPLAGVMSGAAGLAASGGAEVGPILGTGYESAYRL